MAATTTAFELELLAGAFGLRDRGLMAGAAYRLRQLLPRRRRRPGRAHRREEQPAPVEALTDSAMLVSFDAILGP